MKSGLCAFVLVVFAGGCSASPSGDPPAPVASSPPASVSAAPVAQASSAPPPAPPPPATATAAPPETAAAAESAAPAAPAVPVNVENIGMHIGGGPNDGPTKDPIRRSVAPHFEEFKACFAQVDDPAKGGDFGVDILIDRAGGKPKKVRNPKTTLKGKAFRECMVSTFESIDFLKPKGGTTMVSYSLRFTPRRAK